MKAVVVMVLVVMVIAGTGKGAAQAAFPTPGMPCPTSPSQCPGSLCCQRSSNTCQNPPSFQPPEYPGTICAEIMDPYAKIPTTHPPKQQKAEPPKQRNAPQRKYFDPMGR